MTSKHNFMALHVPYKQRIDCGSRNSAVTCTTSLTHRLAGNFGLCECLLHATRHATLTQLALVVQAENGDQERRIQTG